MVRPYEAPGMETGAGTRRKELVALKEAANQPLKL
jgi:hypothetical protein